MRTLRRLQRTQAGRPVRGGRFAAPDATIEPDPGPPPEAVFDRITGPYARRSSAVLPGACACDEDT
jgi:hypothetical protein